MSAPPATAGPVMSRTGLRRTVARRPVGTFLVLALGIGFVALGVPVALGIDYTPFLLVFTFLALLGPALLVSRVADGPGAVRRLLSRTLIWRFSLLRWAVILFGMPVLTLALAAASGSLVSPENGWLPMTGTYLFATLIYGALLINLWEETAWAGFAQTRLMARHGLLVASLITAVFFAGVHVPLYLAGNPTWSEFAFGLTWLFAAAPFYRYLIGMHMLDTRGSLLAAGVQHASWNAAGNLGAVSGEWQAPVAVLLLTVLVAMGRRLRRGDSRTSGREGDKAAAAQWLTPSRSSARPGREPARPSRASAFGR